MWDLSEVELLHCLLHLQLCVRLPYSPKSSDPPQFSRRKGDWRVMDQEQVFNSSSHNRNEDLLHGAVRQALRAVPQPLFHPSRGTPLLIRFTPRSLFSANFLQFPDESVVGGHPGPFHSRLERDYFHNRTRLCSNWVFMFRTTKTWIGPFFTASIYWCWWDGRCSKYTISTLTV